jgi:hypothetical protein
MGDRAPSVNVRAASDTRPQPTSARQNPIAASKAPSMRGCVYPRRPPGQGPCTHRDPAQCADETAGGTQGQQLAEEPAAGDAGEEPAAIGRGRDRGLQPEAEQNHSARQVAMAQRSTIRAPTKEAPSKATFSSVLRRGRAADDELVPAPALSRHRRPRCGTRGRRRRRPRCASTSGCRRLSHDGVKRSATGDPGRLPSPARYGVRCSACRLVRCLGFERSSLGHDHLRKCQISCQGANFACERVSAVVLRPSYAAISSSCSSTRRARWSRRWSSSRTCCPILRRHRKWCRSSSNARQKRSADRRFPKPRIG